MVTWVRSIYLSVNINTIHNIIHYNTLGYEVEVPSCNILKEEYITYTLNISFIIIIINHWSF